MFSDSAPGARVVRKEGRTRAAPLLSVARVANAIDLLQTDGRTMLDLIDPRRQKIFCPLKVLENEQKRVFRGNLVQKFDFWGSRPPRTPPSGGYRGSLPPSYLFRPHAHGYVGNLAQKIDFLGSLPPTTPPSGGTGGPYPPGSIIRRQHAHGHIGNLAQIFDFRGNRPPRTPPSGGTGGSLPPRKHYIVQHTHGYTYS